MIDSSICFHRGYCSTCLQVQYNEPAEVIMIILKSDIFQFTVSLAYLYDIY